MTLVWTGLAFAESGTASAEGAGMAGTVCLLLLCGVVVALLGVAWAVIRQPKSAPSPPTPAPRTRDRPPPPPPPEPDTDYPVDPPKSDGLNERLPETHLAVLHGGTLAGTTWRFSGRKLQLGATEDPENDVVVALSQVSSRHARFELFPAGAVYVTDLGSSNGTWVDGRRLPAEERIEVRPGQRIALSQQLILEIRQPAETE